MRFVRLHGIVVEDTGLLFVNPVGGDQQYQAKMQCERPRILIVLLLAIGMVAVAARPTGGSGLFDRKERVRRRCGSGHPKRATANEFNPNGVRSAT